MRNLIKNKKGNAIGIIVVLVIIFIVAIIALLTSSMSKKFSEKFKELDIPENSSADIAIDRMDDMGLKISDELVLFIFLGLNIGIIVSAVKTKFSPIVIGIYFFLLVFAIMIAAGFTNLYTTFAESSAMSEYGSQMTLTGFIFNRFTPAIICVLSGLIMIFMYGKSENMGSAF